MGDAKLLSISHFEWASVAQYIVYVSAVANLVEIDDSCVHSFRLSVYGPGGLVKRKTKMLSILEGNIARLERFVATFKESLEPVELVVIRGIYRSHMDCVSIVKRHIDIAKSQPIQASLFTDTEEGEDEEEFPF